MESPSTANVVRLDSHPRRSRSDDAKLADRSVERPLSANELFFSTTDEKGVITAGNQVFARVSGYALDEMVGRAHNIVRHPDMPRAVFQILWDTIKAGQPVAAYVKNRTADGAYYWVLASVMPITGGYLSVRLAPGGEHFAIAKSIYGELVALEREIEGDDVRQRKPSIEASVSRLRRTAARTPGMRTTVRSCARRSRQRWRGAPAGSQPVIGKRSQPPREAPREA